MADTRGTGAVMPWALAVPLANFDSVALDLKEGINDAARSDSYEGSNSTYRESSVAMIAGDLLRITETAAFVFKTNARGVIDNVHTYKKGDYKPIAPEDSDRPVAPVVGVGKHEVMEPAYPPGNPYMPAIIAADAMFKMMFNYDVDSLSISDYMRPSIEEIEKDTMDGMALSVDWKGTTVNSFVVAMRDIRVSNNVLEERVDALVDLLAAVMAHKRVEQGEYESRDMRFVAVALIALLRSTSAWSGNPFAFAKMMLVVSDGGIEALEGLFEYYGVSGF